MSSLPTLESCSVGEGGTGTIDDPQRVGLPPRPVQRERRERGHPLAQRERREVGCEQLIRRGCVAGAQMEVRGSFERGAEQPVPSTDRLDDDRLICHLGQRIVPEPDRFAEHGEVA